MVRSAYKYLVSVYFQSPPNLVSLLLHALQQRLSPLLALLHYLHCAMLLFHLKVVELVLEIQAVVILSLEPAKGRELVKEYTNALNSLFVEFANNAICVCYALQEAFCLRLIVNAHCVCPRGHKLWQFRDGLSENGFLCSYKSTKHTEHPLSRRPVGYQRVI